MRKPRFLLAVLGLHGLVAGCAMNDDDMPDMLDESVDAVTSLSGVDYSYARPSKSALHAEGYRFAVRYFSYDTSNTHGKILFKSEAAALQAAGLDVVSNWEYGATNALGGYNSGVADAKEAAAQATAAGAPADRPIYFSVDFDATPGQQTAINAYLDGVASVIGRSRTGIYGGYYPVKRALDAGKVKYAWQTYAWSGGQWDSRAQLRQVQNGITAAGDSGCCDRDVSEARDYGQWSYHVELVSVHANKCLDVTGAGTANGTNIEQWACNGRGSQGFRITPHGSSWMIVNTHSGKCVDVKSSGTANGTNVQLYACNGTGAQLFQMKASGGHTAFVNVHSGKCLDVKGLGTANGTNVELWTCNGGTNQQWIVQQERAATAAAELDPEPTDAE